MSGRSNQFWLVQAATDQKSIPTRLFHRRVDDDEDFEDCDNDEKFYCKTCFAKAVDSEAHDF